MLFRSVCLLRQFRHAADGWIYELPAGKLDNREPPLDCARRELREEAGLELGELGPVVFRDEIVLPWQRRLLRQANAFYLVRVASHAPTPAVDLTLEGVEGLRWWTLAELERLPAEELAPPRLVEVLRGLGRVPSGP